MNFKKEKKFLSATNPTGWCPLTLCKQFYSLALYPGDQETWEITRDLHYFQGPGKLFITNELVGSYFSTLSSVPAVPLLSLRTGHFTMPCPSIVDTCAKHSFVLASDISMAQSANQEAATRRQWKHLSPSPTRSLKMMVGCVRPFKNSPLKYLLSHTAAF